MGFKIEWKDEPLRSRKIKDSNISAGVGYNEMLAAQSWGQMPHQWYAAPRWSRVIANAVSNIQSKLAVLGTEGD